jgi:hypothetical protein
VKAPTFEEERRRAAVRAAFEEFTMVDVVVAMQSGVLSPSWRRSFMSKGEGVRQPDLGEGGTRFDYNESSTRRIINKEGAAGMPHKCKKEKILTSAHLPPSMKTYLPYLVALCVVLEVGVCVS